MEHVLWCVTNRSVQTAIQLVSTNLACIAGQTGRLVVSYTHVNGGYGRGGVLYAPTITNIQVPTVPAVAWDTVVRTDLGVPAILSVSNVVDGAAVSPIREGFFRECKYGEMTAFDVECSDHVENLNAYSSHLALVGERQVTTQVIGPHTFRVFVDASGINEAKSRSRMILTLEAIDANGTKAYKDLSLRFSDEGEAPPVEPLEVTTSVLPPATSGVPYSVTLEAAGGVAPYTWSATTDRYDDSRSANSFSAVGTAQGWQGDDEYWECSLPFEFPFYGSAYSSVRVNSNGTLSFGDSRPGYQAGSTTLSANVMIAVLWKDLKTTGGDIYVERAADHVTIRWDGAYYSPATPVAFSVTLYADGAIRLRYGSGNANGGLVGISSGRGENWGVDWIEVNQYSSSSLANIEDIVFTPRVTLPAWLSLSPAGVLSGTPTAADVSSATVFVSDGAATRAGRTYILTVEAAASQETSTTPVAVPYSWIDEYAAALDPGATGPVPDYERLANMPTGKRNADGSPTYLWQEYVAGTNPTNENDVFTAVIEMVDSHPVVRWQPDLNSNGLYSVRRYTVLGKASLSDAADWAPTNSTHRFFKVTVE